MPGLAYLIVACLLTSTCGFWVSSYKENRRRSNIWAPSRRTYDCRPTGMYCSRTWQCCSPNICLLRMNVSNYADRVRTCENLELYTMNSKPSKPAGYDCHDSRQCYGGCCRVIIGHRYRRNYCGTSENKFTCLGTLN
ncbi:uncharacterized protein LOC121385183 [Gigantopelta aegis]|uniref:uncharacterized protein LOC121385183 n=1 Tax=Gigantopelta aegis TaxID=1735272 RepID=UPI001B8899A5|nr:uncharacterized protein LOC121385183 [Gigantopelta aegis]